LKEKPQPENYQGTFEMNLGDSWIMLLSMKTKVQQAKGIMTRIWSGSEGFRYRSNTLEIGESEAVAGMSCQSARELVIR